MAASRLFQKFYKLSYKLSHEDEPWEYTEEPHAARRKEILRKHPEIKKLMGYDVSIAYIVITEVVLQLIMCWLLQDTAWRTIVVLSYIVGATLNHSLGSSIHEIGHNLAFGHGRPMWNRVLGIVANLPMGIPISVTYKRYHSDHHRYLGHQTLDVDIPSVLEAYLFRRWYTKIIWLLIHPAIHGIRPYMKSPKPPSKLEFINVVCQVLFDFAIFQIFGIKSLAYLVIGTLFGLGFHPTAGHFISEHYMFTKGQATISYYGPMNPLLFNVGYHVEHHDFPYVPGTRLPEVKRLAPEYYDDLPYHTSWVKVLWQFIFDPENGPHARGVGYRKADVDATKHVHVANGHAPTESEANGHAQTETANRDSKKLT